MEVTSGIKSATASIGAVKGVTGRLDYWTGSICSLAVDIGLCNTSYYKRWYFDGDQRTCLPFLYSGCGGNLNRFKNFQSCEEYCSVLLGNEYGSGELDVQPDGSEYGVVLECKGGGNRRSPRISFDQQHWPAQFPHEVSAREVMLAHWHIFWQITLCLLPLLQSHAGDEDGIQVSDFYDNVMQKRALAHLRAFHQPLTVNCTSGDWECLCSAENEIVDERPQKVHDQCDAANRECSQLRCLYRIDKFMDGDCTRCRCHDPCRDARCPESTQCAVDLFSNPETGETEFRDVCRK
ncbi:hypothetical protein PR048_017143, partial [Dryococelus australis]